MSDDARPWTEHDLCRAAYMAGAGESAGNVAAALDRTVDAVYGKMRRCGVAFRGARGGLYVVARIGLRSWRRIAAQAHKRHEDPVWLCGAALDELSLPDWGDTLENICLSACDEVGSP